MKGVSKYMDRICGFKTYNQDVHAIEWLGEESLCLLFLILDTTVRGSSDSVMLWAALFGWHDFVPLVPLWKEGVAANQCKVVVNDHFYCDETVLSWQEWSLPGQKCYHTYGMRYQRMFWWVWQLCESCAVAFTVLNLCLNLHVPCGTNKVVWLIHWLIDVRQCSPPVPSKQQMSEWMNVLEEQRPSLHWSGKINVEAGLVRCVFL